MKKLTEKEFAKCEAAGMAAFKEVPSRNCRQATKAKAKATIAAIDKTVAKKRDLRDDELIGKKVTIVYRYQVNLGNSSYPDFYTGCFTFTTVITRMTDKTVFCQGYLSGLPFKKAKTSILGVIF